MSLLRTVLGGQYSPLITRALGLSSTVGLPPLPSISIGISLDWPFSWSGILQAAPKKRTSHQKKRQRQLAGNNQQKPLRNLNRCPACGHMKRAHTLCMHCVQEVRKSWRDKERQELEAKRDPSKHYDDSKLTPEDIDFNYPKRINRPSANQEKLEDTESYVLQYPKTLPAQQKPTKEKKLPLLLRRPYK